MKYLVDPRRIWQVAGVIFVAGGLLFAATASARVSTVTRPGVSHSVDMVLNSKTTTRAAGSQSRTGQNIGWPQPRFDAARTAYNPLETSLNAGNVTRLHPVWRNPQPYFDNFDLVAANGVLYQGGTDGKSFVAINLDSGKVQWRFVPGDFVSMSPVVGPRFVYAASTALYALDPTTGQVRWRFIPPNHRTVSSTPVLSRGLLFLPICLIQHGPRVAPQPCSLYALSASSGRKVRVYGDSDGAIPAIGDRAVCLTHQGNVQAISIASGRRLWNFAPPVGAKGQYHLAGNDVAVSNGVVYVAGACSDTVYALDAATGRELWWFRAGLRHGQFTDAALAYGDLYVGQIGDGPKAGLYSLNGRTGHVNWVFRDTYGFETGPSVANGVVYAADPDSGLFALSASTGRRLWSATVKHTGNISHVASDPIVVNGMLYLDRSPRGVFAYGLSPAVEALQSVLGQIDSLHRGPEAQGWRRGPKDGSRGLKAQGRRGCWRAEPRPDGPERSGGPSARQKNGTRPLRCGCLLPQCGGPVCCSLLLRSRA